MKTASLVVMCLLLSACNKTNETQLMTETGRQLQRAIDTSPARAQCEAIAKGREWISLNVRRHLEKQGCAEVFRSSTETNFTQSSIYHTSMTMVCGSISGGSFTGETLSRRFIYSPEENALVIEPTSTADKTRFEKLKTVAQLQADFERQYQQYCH
ncbi:hypothetical protein [Candidatus Pantoea multigeneris]|uniref:Lipoprotein n=1 Tax=Candidatus Pantoea multigeneris TaxID=2608357 RepID=A0ABX0R9X4_9GAMM|nr:hypothetical protein [Pantoea multigeneris]NIF20050.1 hypothetical protein [Pantoea multigeneris]